MNNRKNTVRTERIQQRVEAGLVSKRFPQVAGIIIRMEYTQKGISKSLLRTVNFSPDSYAFFRIDCLSKDCVDGGFDMTRIISTMVRSRREVAKGELCCGGNGSVADHAAITYEVAIQYS